MLNLKYKPSRYVRLQKASVSAGDPVNVNGITGIAVGDTDASGYVEIDIGHEVSVYDLEVVGVDESGNSAVAVGDRLYLDGAAVNKDGVNGTFIGRALGTVNSGATATIGVLLGALSSGIPNTTETVKKIVQTVAIGDFTDNEDATGYVDLDDPLPAGAVPLGWEANVATGFTNNTSAVLQVGVQGDLDRFSAVTDQSVFATGRVGASALGRADSLDGIGSAQTIRCTVTGNSDFTSINAGSMTITFYYVAGDEA